jgi:peptidoglycan/xylan/chitin deacetylase (PgdA/CDA1 family)
MNYKKKYQIKKLISKSLGKYLSSKGRRILMYHSLGTEVSNDIYGIYSVNENLFEQQMQHLREYFCDNLTSIEDFSTNKLSITITFDDGFADVLYKAAPILCRLNIPFTVFVPPKMVIEKNHYLSIHELKELSRLKNCIIGAHGFSHAPLTRLNFKDAKEEIYKSKIWLEDIIGKEVVYMSYPHGAINSKIKYEVENCGFISASSSKPGVNKDAIDMFELRRTSILSHDCLDQFISKINGDWDWTRWI